MACDYNFVKLYVCAKNFLLDSIRALCSLFFINEILIFPLKKKKTQRMNFVRKKGVED
jgi:hypothetical protein